MAGTQRIVDISLLDRTSLRASFGDVLQFVVYYILLRIALRLARLCRIPSTGSLFTTF